MRFRQELKPNAWGAGAVWRRKPTGMPRNPRRRPSAQPSASRSRRPWRHQAGPDDPVLVQGWEGASPHGRLRLETIDGPVGDVSEDSIGGDKLPAGQTWAISAGGQDEGANWRTCPMRSPPGCRSYSTSMPRTRCQRRCTRAERRRRVARPWMALAAAGAPIAARRCQPDTRTALPLEVWRRRGPFQRSPDSRVAVTHTLPGPKFQVRAIRITI